MEPSGFNVTISGVSNTLTSVGIFMVAVILALIWKFIYFCCIRRCFNIQRWPSLTELEHILDLHDHIQHNTMSDIPATADSKSGSIRGSFVRNGVPLKSYMSRRRKNGVTLEVDTMTQPVDFTVGTDSVSNMSSPLIDQEYRKIKSKSFFQYAPWDDEYYEHSDDEEYGVDTQKKKKKCCSAMKRTWSCCGKSSNWKEKTYSIHDLPLGYSFRQGHWIPRTIEGRSMSKYLRGNFLTLVGSSGVVALILGGLKLALEHSDFDLGTTLTTATGIALISFFKLADFFAPILSYFTILLTDSFERGELVEVTNLIGGLNGVVGTSLTGCVMEIGPFQVSMLCTKPYSTLASLVGPDKMLNRQGQIVPATTFQNQVQRHFTNMSPLNAGSSANLHAPVVGVSTTHHIPATSLNSESNTASDFSASLSNGVIYLERDFVKTKMVVRVPTNIFANCILGKHVSWVPVANLQQIGRMA